MYLSDEYPDSLERDDLAEIAARIARSVERIQAATMALDAMLQAQNAIEEDFTRRLNDASVFCQSELCMVENDIDLR